MNSFTNGKLDQYCGRRPPAGPHRRSLAFHRSPTTKLWSRALAAPRVRGRPVAGRPARRGVAGGALRGRLLPPLRRRAAAARAGRRGAEGARARPRRRSRSPAGARRCSRTSSGCRFRSRTRVLLRLARRRGPVVVDRPRHRAVQRHPDRALQRRGFVAALAAADRLIVHTDAGRAAPRARASTPRRIRVIPHGPLGTCRAAPAAGDARPLHPRRLRQDAAVQGARPPRRRPRPARRPPPRAACGSSSPASR